MSDETKNRAAINTAGATHIEMFRALCECVPGLDELHEDLRYETRIYLERCQRIEDAMGETLKAWQEAYRGGEPPKRWGRTAERKTDDG